MWEKKSGKSVVSQLEGLGREDWPLVLGVNLWCSSQVWMVWEAMVPSGVPVWPPCLSEVLLASGFCWLVPEMQPLQSGVFERGGLCCGMVRAPWTHLGKWCVYGIRGCRPSKSWVCRVGKSSWWKVRACRKARMVGGLWWLQVCER